MTLTKEEQNDIQFMLKNTIQQLGLIPVDKLEEYVTNCRDDISRADSLGPIMDPTGYRDALQSGAYEDARLQLKIVEKLLEAVKMGVQRDNFVQQMGQKKRKLAEGIHTDTEENLDYNAVPSRRTARGRND